MVPKQHSAHRWADELRGKPSAGIKLTDKVGQIWKCCSREGPQYIRVLELALLSRPKMCRDAPALGGIHAIDLPAFISARGSWHLDKPFVFETH